MKISKLVTCTLLGACGGLAQSMPADYDGVLKTLGKQGDFKVDTASGSGSRTDW